MTTIFNSSKWLDSPLAYWTIDYECKRSGADMLYRFYWKVWLGYSSAFYYDGLQLQLFLNGSQKNVTVKIYNDSENGWSYEGTTGWYTVSNKATGTVPFYARLYDINSGAVKVTSSSYSLEVSAIAPTITQELYSKTETEITMHWLSDSIIDALWYSIDNGVSWKKVTVPNSQLGFYTIPGLDFDTKYTIKTRVRKKEGQVITDSSALSVTTYDYPYCVSSPNFVIGDAVTLKFYNPLNRTFKFFIIANGTQIAQEYSCSGTSYTGLNSAKSSVPQLYATIPNDKKGKYQVKVAYEDSIRIQNEGNTFEIRGTECPTFGEFTYEDGDEISSNITGDKSLIVQNQSSLVVKYEQATSQYSATIKDYTFTYNGEKFTQDFSDGVAYLGSINSAEDITVEITATDSRGLTGSVFMVVTMVKYSPPEAVISLERVNNYEDETHLKVDAIISSVNGKNSVSSVLYRYLSQDADDYIDYKSIPEGDIEVVNVSKEKIYTFEVWVRDAFGSSCHKEVTLGKGVFPLFIDTEKNAVGINEFPEEGEALRVKDGVAHFVDGIKIADKTLFDFLYPVGSVYCTGSNTSPGDTMGGTWELISKEFSDMSSGTYVNENGEAIPCFDSNGDAKTTFSWVRNGHTIYTRFSFEPTLVLTGQSFIGIVDLEKLGVTDLCYDKYAVGFSNDGDAVFQAKLDNKGDLSTYDIIGKTASAQLGKGANCYVEFVNVISNEYKIDSACDKFYWKRTE